ncbi:DUF6894 family protein [Sphingomonas sp. 3-13AW]|uniref:DUF6894 family protein n=1 Tax=Sphingomonas sp. 3-13AW TaxID=3050450 RepID=UPI003BB74460
MPRYRFVVDDGSDAPSADLFECTDYGQAKRTAVNYITELLRERDEASSSACGCQVQVSEEHGPVRFTVEMRAFESDLQAQG